MDYMDVYTTYTLFFVAIVTVCVIASALFNAYVAVKVRRDSLFWHHLLVQAALLILLCGKLLELVSPTQEVAKMHLDVQRTGSLLLSPALLLFLFALKRHGTERKLIWRSYAMGIAALVCAAAVFFEVPEWIFDCSPVCAFLLWSTYVFCQRQNVFAEFSDMSLDVFMERTEDAVLIFDRSERLMDCNQNAKTMFPFMDATFTIGDFYGRLRAQTPEGDPLPPSGPAISESAEIGLGSQCGMRYYLHSATPVKNRRNVLIATVLTFHDVTEQTLLLRELERKNTELDELNAVLKRYITVAHQLEDERERNRAVMEIQETIGQSIAELLIGLEALRTVGTSQEAIVKGRLSEMIESCRTVMSEIRKSVERLTAHHSEKE